MRHEQSARWVRPRARALAGHLGLTASLGLGMLPGCMCVIGSEGIDAKTVGPGAPVSPTGGGGPTGPTGAGAGPACDQAAKSFAPARLWQLTDEQYVNVVRDVLGVALEGPDAQIISAAVPDRYTNYSEGALIGLQIAPSYQLA